MPNYEFRCKKCEKKWSELVWPSEIDETEKYPTIKCPDCESVEKDRLMSVCNFQFSNPVDTDRWNNGSTGHDYRFKHNIPNLMAERKHAEEVSHMGSNPYGDTSVEDIALDTGVHDAEFRKGLT